jgi:geranylgeranyl diphosphate synthase type I
VTENAAGAGVPVGVIQAAAALELIQACALIHDDIIDRSDTRRGRPSVHRSVEKLHADSGWTGDAAHFGVSAALLIGDLALAWADDLFVAGLSGLGSPVEAVEAWRAMRTEVLAGQLLDLRITADEAADPQTAAADATIVNRYKTAAYTVERPLHLGAALARARPATVDALRRYGQAIGVAFQLRDDLLGVFGDPAVTGKPAGGDLIEGKRTVLLAMARAALAGSAERLAELDQGIGTSLGPAEIDRLTQLVAETGAPQAIEARISALLTEGLAALDATDSGGRPLIRSDAASDLRALALAATARER